MHNDDTPTLRPGRVMDTLGGPALVEIARTGGGLTVSTNVPVGTLKVLAEAASRSGAILRITEASRLPVSDLVNIAAAGRGCIFFEG